MAPEAGIYVRLAFWNYELVCLSSFCCGWMVMEGTVKNTYVRANIIYFAAVSKPNDCIFPYDFKEEIKKKVIPFGW